MNRYLTLLKKSLAGELYAENEARLHYLRQCLAGEERFELARYLHMDAGEFRRLAAEGRVLDGRLENLGFPQTMIGRARLDNIEWCLDEIRRYGVAGDLIECGVWRGGAAVFMRGYLAAHHDAARLVWVADSFAGPPPPSLPQDRGEDLSAAACPMLAISLETVRDLFARYDLLDAKVRFLAGWFKDTLPGAPIEELALLRLDADLYQSTRDALAALYDKVAAGGFVIVDDYGCIPACRQAVDEFRAGRRIADPIVPIDWTGVYWRKSHARKAARVFGMLRGGR